jgi:hypothetical protein
MKYNIKSVALVVLTLSLALPAAALVQDTYPWAVRDSLSSAITNFKLSSPIIVDMRTYDAPDEMALAPVADGDGTDDTTNVQLMPIYTLLACMHFTNVNSEMTVDSVGGYDIKVKNAQFARGSWDAAVRIIERVEINMLETDKTLILKKVVVGNITMSNNADRLATVRMMVANCFPVGD